MLSPGPSSLGSPASLAPASPLRRFLLSSSALTGAPWAAPIALNSLTTPRCASFRSRFSRSAPVSSTRSSSAAVSPARALANRRAEAFSHWEKGRAGRAAQPAMTSRTWPRSKCSALVWRMSDLARRSRRCEWADGGAFLGCGADAVGGSERRWVSADENSAAGLGRRVVCLSSVARNQNKCKGEIAKLTYPRVGL